MKNAIDYEPDSENEVEDYTIMPKVDFQVSKLEVPVKIQKIISKIEQAQLLRTREEISSQLNDILQNVQRIIHRYTFDESIQFGKKIPFLECKQRRLKVLEKMDYCANSADIKRKTLMYILAWLEEWHVILSDMTATDVDDRHFISQMEILPETFKSFEGNVKRLSLMSTSLLEQKKKQKGKRTSRKALWKSWKDRVLKRPATANALTPNQMINDEFATNTKVSEINYMLQELIDTTMFNKLENNAINYIASTISNLSKALTSLNNEVKVTNLYPDVYISEAGEKETSLQIIKELSEENEMLQQKLKYAEEKCEQLIKFKAWPPSTLKVLSGISPQSHKGFHQTDEEESIDNILIKEYENTLGKAQRKGTQGSVFKWDSAISHTSQVEMTAGLIDQQSPLPEKPPKIPSKDITEDRISLKEDWTDEYQSQERKISKASYELQTSRSSLTNQTSKQIVSETKGLQVEQKTSREVQLLSVDKTKSLIGSKSQRVLSKFPSTDTKSQGGKSRTSKWERLRKQKLAYIISKDQVISRHKKKSTTELMNKESKSLKSIRAESSGITQLDKSAEKVKIKEKEHQVSSEITTSKEGKTEEKDTSVFTKKVKSHELAESQSKIIKETSESTSAPGSPDGKSEQDNLDEFHNAIMSFLKEKIDNTGTPLDKKTVPEAELLLKKAEVEKLGIIKTKMEEYFQNVAGAVAKILRKYKDIKKEQIREKQMKQKQVLFITGLDLQRPISAKSEISSLLSSESMDPVIQNLTQEILTEIEKEEDVPVVLIAGKDHKEKKKQRQEKYLQVQRKILDMNLKQQQLQEERNLWKMKYEKISKGLEEKITWLQMKEGKREQQKEKQWLKEVLALLQKQRMQKQTEQDEMQKGMGEEEQQKQKQHPLEAWMQRMKVQGVSFEEIQKEVKHLELESSWKEEEEKQKPERKGEDDESQWPKKTKEQKKIRKEIPENLENTLSYASITLTPRWKDTWKKAFQLQKKKEFHMKLADEKYFEPAIPSTSTQFSSPGPLSIPRQYPTKSMAVIHEEAKDQDFTLSPEQAQALGITVTPQQAQAQWISLTPEQAQRLGFIVTPEEAQALGITLKSQQLQVRGEGISLIPQQDRGLGAIVTPQQAETQRVSVIPEQAKELRFHLTPEQAQAQGIALTPQQAQALGITLTTQQAEALGITLTPQQAEELGITLTPQQAEELGITLTPQQAEELGITLTPQQALAQGITVTPQQAEALGITLTPQQALAQGITVTPQQAEELGITLTPQQAQRLGITFTPQQALAQGITVTPQQAEELGITLTPQQAKELGITLTPQQAEELGITLTTQQAQAQGIIVTPQQAEALGITVTPQQALAQGITVTPQQAEELGITLTPQQAEELGITLTPQQALAQGITVTPQQAEALGITVTPQQALAQGITVTPQQAEELGITFTPQQAEELGITLTPQQALAQGITVTPQQAEALGITLTPQQAEELGITLTPQQAEELGITLTPQQALAQGITVTPQQAEELGITLTPQQAEELDITLTPQQAEELGITLTPQQAQAQGITVTPQQAEALGITLTPQQAEELGITLTPQQAEELGITLTPQQALAQGITVTPQQAEELDITLTPQQAEELDITLTPQQAEELGITLTPQQAQAQGITVTPQQAEELGITLTPQQTQGIIVTPQEVEDLGITLTPQQAEELGITLTPQQAQAQGITLTPQQAQTQGITVTPRKARTRGITLTRQQAQALGIPLNPQKSWAQGITVTPQQALALGIIFTRQQARALGIPVTHQHARARRISLTPQQAQALGIPFTRHKARAKRITVTPQQAQALGIILTPRQARAQGLTVSLEQAQALGITATSQRVREQGITATPQQARAQGLTVTPEQAQAQAQGITLTPQQAEAQGITAPPQQSQAQAQRITVTPRQAQALGITLTPEQAQAQQITLTPQQAQALGFSLTPQQAQAQAQGITVTPRQAQALGITVTPQQDQAQAQAQGITITPQQAQGEDITLTHEQLKALMVTLTPEKSQELRVTLTHEQDQALRAPVILQQEGTPTQGQTLKAPATSEQSQAMQIPVTTQQAQILGVPITQGQDEALGVTITPQQTEAQTRALMFTLTPEKAQIPAITHTNEQALAEGIPLTPEQVQVLGIPLTLDQAQALETPLTAEQAWRLEGSITPEMVQEVSHTLSLKQSEALGITPTYEQAQPFGTPLLLNQAQALGIPIPLTLRPEQTLGVSLTSDKAHDLGSPLTHEQVQPLGAPFTPGQAQPMGTTHMSRQSLESRAPPINEQFSQLWAGPPSGQTLEGGIFSIPDESIKRSAPYMPKLPTILTPSTPKPFQESKTSFLSGQATTRTRQKLLTPLPSSKQTLVSKGKFTHVQFLEPEVPPIPGKLPVSGTPPTPGQPLPLDSLLSPRQFLIPRDSLTPQSPLVSKVPLISGIPSTSSQIPSLWDPLFPGKPLIPRPSSVPGELTESGHSTFSEQPQAFQLPTTHEQSPYLQAPSALGQLRTLPGQAFPLWISPSPGYPSTLQAPSTLGKPPKDLFLKPKSELVHPSAPHFKVPQTPFTTKKFQISEVSDTSKEIQELQDSFAMEQLGTFQSYLTNYRTSVSQTPYIEGPLPALMKPITSLPPLTTQLPKRSQISPSEWDWKSRFPPISKPCVLTSVSDTKKLKMMIPSSSFQELKEQRYFVDVKAQRKNLILLNQTTETSGLPSELYITARNLIIETLHTDTVRLGYLFRKYIAYRLIQRARNNIIKRLQAIQNSGKGYEIQDLYIMLNRIDGYQKKMMGVWTGKQKSLEQNRNQCLRKMMLLFSQLQNIYKLNLSQPVPLFIDKKQKPTPIKRIQEPFLDLPMKEDRKSDIFKKLRKQDQMEAIWNADQSASSYPIIEKTSSIRSLWAQLGGYPPVPMLLQLDVQSTFRKSLASIQSQFNKNRRGL